MMAAPTKILAPAVGPRTDRGECAEPILSSIGSGNRSSRANALSRVLYSLSASTLAHIKIRRFSAKKANFVCIQMDNN